MVRLLCAVCGGDGGAHLRPPGHHTAHAAAPVPKPILVSRTWCQGFEGGGLHSGFLFPLPLLSPPHVPKPFLAPVRNDFFLGPDSSSTCLCHLRTLSPSTGPYRAQLFCLCSGGTLREERRSFHTGQCCPGKLKGVSSWALPRAAQLSFLCGRELGKGPGKLPREQRLMSFAEPPPSCL